MDKDRIKQAARGRWREVISALSPLTAAQLDGRHQPCPKCGGTDRFRAFDDVEQTGGVICNQCLPENNGDGLAVLQWINGWTFPEVLSNLGRHLGLNEDHEDGALPRTLREPATLESGMRKYSVRPIGDDQESREQLERWVANKPGVTVPAAVSAAAHSCAWPADLAHECVAFPAFVRHGSPPRGFILYRCDGEDFPAFARLPQRKTHMLGGSKDGWIILGGWTALNASRHVLKTEGLPDALAVAPLLPQGWCVVTNICGCSSCPAPELLAGKQVTLIPDADTPGITGARKAARLLDQHAASVQLLSLPFEVSETHGQDLRDWVLDGNGAAEFRQLLETAEPISWKGSRPEVVLNVDEEDRVISETCHHLGRLDRDLYERNRSLVRIIRVAPTTGAITRPEGSLIISEVREAILRQHIARHVSFVEVRQTEEGGHELVPKAPPVWCIRATKEQEHWSGMRYLHGVVSNPVLRPDGTVLHEKGYDPGSGLFLHTLREFPPVPDHPCARQVREAVDVLLDVVCDFPFAAEVHQSAWVAAVLTPLARFAYQGPTGPIFLFDSNVRGSGKTLLASLATLIATGRPAAVMTAPRDNEEFRKRITSVAIAADPVVLLDNIRGSLGCASLDAALTNDVWSDRILGESRTITTPLRMTWLASGNNTMLSCDTARRVCHCRLESALENPEDRDGFRYPDIKRYVQENQPRLLCAALTILRGYIAAGRPSQRLKPWGSFEGWSDLVRQAIVWAGLPDPGETRTQLRLEADTEAAAVAALLETLTRIDPQATGLTSSEMIRIAERRTTSYDESDVDALEAALNKLCPKLTARSLGNRLRQFRNRVVGGKQLRDRKSNRLCYWYVHQGYESDESNESIPATSRARPGLDRPHMSKTRSERPPGETDSLDSSDSYKPPPLDEIRHKRAGCAGPGWWESIFGGHYCLACYPPTDEAAVARRA